METHVIDIVNASPVLAVYAWTLGAFAFICLCIVACLIGLATIKADDRSELAACFRGIAEIIKAFRKPAK
jgi:hypothetical protein